MLVLEKCGLLSVSRRSCIEMILLAVTICAFAGLGKPTTVSRSPDRPGQGRPPKHIELNSQH